MFAGPSFASGSCRPCLCVRSYTPLHGRNADSPDNSSIPQGRHAMTRIIVGQRCPIRWPPRPAIVGGIRLDNAPNTGSHRHVAVSRLAFGLPCPRLDDTLSGEAAVGLSAIRGQIDEIRPDPLFALLKVVAGPRFRRDVRPSVLQTRVSRCLERWGGRIC